MSVKKRASGVLLAFSVALAGLSGAFAQQQGQQPQYSAEEYQAYQKAVNVKDLSQRSDSILAFIHSNPKSALVPYAESSYIQLMQEMSGKGDMKGLAAAGEKFLAVKPSDLNALYMTAFATFQLQQFHKTVEYGEKAYGQKSDLPKLSYILALSYKQLQMQDKYAFYGEKACKEVSVDECYQVLADLTRIYVQKKDLGTAAEFARKTLQGLKSASKPTQSSAKEWQDYLNRERGIAYAVLGRSDAERKNWSGALSNYQRAMKFYSNPQLNGEAFYYIGMAQWRQQQLDPAMEAFANGSVQSGSPYAKVCRQYLEKLYKSTHNDSLAGLDEYVQRVVGAD